MSAPVIDPTILPTSDEEQLRHEVAVATLLLNQKNIIGYSGHVSVRLPGDDALLIQPVDHSRAELHPEQLLVCNLEGRRVDETETERPPSEVFIHSAASGDRCNTGIKSICRGLEPQGLTWPFVEPAGDLI